MKTETETSLRVRFAKAMGYVIRFLGEEIEITRPYNAKHAQGEKIITSFPDDHLPDPTDANTVREALMGMTDLEWEKFSGLLAEKLGYGNGTEYVIKQTLKQEPPTLAELICEVRGIHE